MSAVSIIARSSRLARMLDALKLDDVDEQNYEAEDTEADGQHYAEILRDVHTVVCVNTCTRPHTCTYVTAAVTTITTPAHLNHQLFIANSCCRK